VVDEDGQQVGVMRTQDAQRMAREAGKDLVEIQPNAKPPVCRIMNFGKFQYEQSKRRSQQKRNQKVIALKEIKFRPTTDVGDYKVKLKKISDFLVRGDKVKVTVRFRGREMMHRDLGLDLLERLKKDLLDLAVVDMEAKLEGRQMTMGLSPGKKAIELGKQLAAEKPHADDEDDEEDDSEE
jgi:translation initiation factor IF-3